MEFREFCKSLSRRMATVRSRYRDRNPMGDRFDWDINWTMKTMGKGNGYLEDIILDVQKLGLNEDQSYSRAIADLRAFVFLDNIVILENYTEMALAKLERLREALIRGLENREVPTVGELDV